MPRGAKVPLLISVLKYLLRPGCGEKSRVGHSEKLPRLVGFIRRDVSDILTSVEAPKTSKRKAGGFIESKRHKEFLKASLVSIFFFLLTSNLAFHISRRKRYILSHERKCNFSYWNQYFFDIGFLKGLVFWQPYLPVCEHDASHALPTFHQFQIRFDRNFISKIRGMQNLKHNFGNEVVKH